MNIEESKNAGTHSASGIHSSNNTRANVNADTQGFLVKTSSPVNPNVDSYLDIVHTQVKLHGSNQGVDCDYGCGEDHKFRDTREYRADGLHYARIHKDLSIHSSPNAGVSWNTDVTNFPLHGEARGLLVLDSRLDTRFLPDGNSRSHERYGDSYLKYDVYDD